MTDDEFTALLEDTTKEIAAHIVWKSDADHSPAVEFRVNVFRESGPHLLEVNGSYNHEAQTLSFTLIAKGVGRIYGLDLGKAHRNPDRTIVGETHKHTWTERHLDQVAYEPRDITAPVNAPVEVWEQFCAEARIKHTGRMSIPHTANRGLLP